MRQLTTLGFALFVFFANAGTVADDAVATGPPIQANVIDRDRGKGYFCTVDLTLTNNHDFPMWFVFADSSNELLRHDGRFSSDYDVRRIQFGASAYQEGKGTAVVLSHYGADGFLAIRMPKKGRLYWAGFVVSAPSPIRFVDVWEVRSLKVNGTTPLEKWLPYDVTSSASVELSGRMHSGNFQVLGGLEGASESSPYFSELVKTVHADAIQRHIIQLPE